MTPWVPVSRTVTADGNFVTVQVDTDLPTHLHICTQSTKPIKIPRMQTRRGVPIVCGFFLRYSSPVCVEQNEPGDTTEHTFDLIVDNINEPPWATISTSDPIQYGAQQTAPFQLIPDVIMPTLPTIALRRDTDIIVGDHGSVLIPWEAIIWQQAWPYNLVDPQHIPWPATGWVQLVVQVPWQAAHDTALWIEAATNAPPRFLRDVRGTNNAGQDNLQTMAGMVHATIGDVIQFTLRSDGTANMSTEIGGPQIMYVAMHYLSIG